MQKHYDIAQQAVGYKKHWNTKFALKMVVEYPRFNKLQLSRGLKELGYEPGRFTTEKYFLNVSFNDSLVKSSSIKSPFNEQATFAKIEIDYTICLIVLLLYSFIK